MLRPFLLFALIASMLFVDVVALGGEPMAIRRWPDGKLTVETFAGQEITFKTDGAWQITDPGDASDTGHDSLKVETVTLGDDSVGAAHIEALGVHAIIVSGASLSRNWNAELPESLAADVLVIGGEDVDRLKTPQVKRLIEKLDPPRILLSGLDPDSDTFAEVAKWMLGEDQTRHVTHNTIAVGSSHSDPIEREIIALTDTAWEMPDDVDELFTAMEKSCEASQKVFAELTVQQMNFKPANGTHTPRWNAEHMVGRQLQFFSQIYHAIDPAVPVMDFNPKQMPPDYDAAHPDWSGADEARRMSHVSDFCRRFAYLLDGIKPNEKAPGSRWPTLGALLKQMDRHYDEHTANTVKKFDLPNWPGK
ncbi:hypothetical protein Poly51_23840 [Rubripirellula tenax]|uniref:DinB superfamily protein n=1 Tax=Rubripirellula tenax TaxID=2528015 RepID=A0A5C6F3Z1_9BACT|nr:DinB family protein [Rubripirellula tenax]TWU56473.1 hypothetical protein Poly51_23840 [Rubripirellula tenax]